jgi:hypothetical protein
VDHLGSSGMEQQFKEIWFEVWEGSVVQYAGNKSLFRQRMSHSVVFILLLIFCHF